MLVAVEQDADDAALGVECGAGGSGGLSAGPSGAVTSSNSASGSAGRLYSSASSLPATAAFTRCMTVCPTPSGKWNARTYSATARPTVQWPASNSAKVLALRMCVAVTASAARAPTIFASSSVRSA